MKAHREILHSTEATPYRHDATAAPVPLTSDEQQVLFARSREENLSNTIEGRVLFPRVSKQMNPHD